MNLFDLPERMPCEASCPLLERPGLRIERIVSWDSARPRAFGTTRRRTSGFVWFGEALCFPLNGSTFCSHAGIIC